MKNILFFIFTVVLAYVIISPVMVMITFMCVKIRKEGVIFVIWQFVNYALLVHIKNDALYLIMTILSVPLLWYYCHLIKDEC